MSHTTRNQLFQSSFTEFVKILEDAHEYEIYDWKCNSVTTNPRSNTHKYEFKIPARRVLYEVDIPRFENGVWIEPGPIYESQVLPTTELFNSLINNYFKPFVLSDRKLYSYVDFTSLSIDATTGLTCEIYVVYYKTHIPYPLSITPTSKKEVRLMSKIQCLNEEIDENNETIRELNDTLDKFVFKSSKRLSIINKLKTKLREQYSKQPELDDCPVCYEKITPEMLNISHCCHYVCTDCIKKCTSCPLCREKN
jgi:hypothetical protein